MLRKPVASYVSANNSDHPRSSAVPLGLPDHMRQNGSLDGQPVGKRRRGRRKNVEGMDLLFMNRNQVPPTPDQVSAHTADLISPQPQDL